MPEKITANKFKVGTNAIVLFQNINGLPLMEVLMSEEIPLPLAIEIMACTWKDGTIDSYSEFKELPAFQDVALDFVLREEVFQKITGDITKKLAQIKKKAEAKEK